MEPEDKVEGRDAGPAERRSSPRFQVGAEAEIFVVGHGLSLNCRILDLSLHGCRVYTGGRIPSEIRLPVEVTFSVNKIPFRLAGLIRRSTGQQQVGIEFAGMTERRMAEWAEVVDEVQLALATQLEAEAALGGQEAAAGPGENRDTDRDKDRAADENESKAVFQPMPGDERRKTTRFECKGVAEIRVLPLCSRRPGTLLDLSAGGCSIETRDPFPAVENPCVEVTLTLSGFNLRVAGVVRHLYEKNRAGVEFTGVTERKAAQIVELVAELIEIDTRRRARFSMRRRDSAPSTGPCALGWTVPTPAHMRGARECRGVQRSG